MGPGLRRLGTGRPREDFDEAILIVPWIGGVYAVRGVANALLGRDSASLRDIDLAAQRGLDRRLVERAIKLERSKAGNQGLGASNSPRLIEKDLKK